MRGSIIEQDDAPGGRVLTDELDGFLLDRGFQVYLELAEKDFKACKV
jgi:phytoene dehydrogenase-like protein